MQVLRTLAFHGQVSAGAVDIQTLRAVWRDGHARRVTVDGHHYFALTDRGRRALDDLEETTP